MTYGVWMALGVLALLYFGDLLINRVDFCMIWLPAGLFLLAVGFYRRLRMLHPKGFRLPAPLLWTAGLVIGVVCFLFTVVEIRIFTVMHQSPPQNLEYIIVLGAQVKGTRPSLALEKRLRKAQEYLEENPQTRAILSGGQGDGEDISEALCMSEYLIEHGVEEGRLLLEDRSTTTLENLQFSEEILRRQGASKHASIGILTNNFHVYRALRLAEHMGYTDSCGIAASSDWRLQPHYLVREFFALIKEKVRGNI